MRDHLVELAAEGLQVDSVVTDPPYHLTDAGRGAHAASASPSTPHGRARVGERGFMGTNWDGGDIAFRPETWALVAGVMKPGAFLLAFGGTRTHHRVMCAIEDAGFELRDVIGWLYGSGFPKSKNLRDRGMGTGLKPAWEPIIVARKRFPGSMSDNVALHGTGALHIDACRISTYDDLRVGNAGTFDAMHAHEKRERKGEASAERRYADRGATNIAAKPGPRGGDVKGRWPANIIHDGSDEVLATFPDEAGAAAPVHRRNADKFRGTYGAFAGDVDEQGSTFQGDSGSAARFFYCAKASRADRNEGLSGFVESPLLWSSGAQSPGTFQSANTNRASENSHPTVKPTTLMRYLCKLVTPPRGLILDCFMGSGSTGKAAALEGFDFIGIEGEQRHVDCAAARIRHAEGPLFSELTA
jgi:site-specific DNA-methyltransferase (adenine-specific)